MPDFVHHPTYFRFLVRETSRMDFYKAVAKRQSVRKYKSDLIPENGLNRILESFQRAPSWANVQPWELVLVTDPEIKSQLQTTLPSGNPAMKAIVDAPVLVCIIGIPDTSGWYKGKPVTGRGDWMLFDVGIAAEHITLAAAAEGLGTVHVGLFDYEKAGKILCIPSNRTVVELMPLGFPDHEPKPVGRKSIEAFVFRNKYGQK